MTTNKSSNFDSVSLLIFTLLVLVSNVYIITTMYNELNIRIGFNLPSLEYIYTYLLMLFFTIFKLSSTSVSNLKTIYDKKDTLSTEDKAKTLFITLALTWCLYGFYNAVCYFI